MENNRKKTKGRKFVYQEHFRTIKKSLIAKAGEKDKNGRVLKNNKYVKLDGTPAHYPKKSLGFIKHIKKSVRNIFREPNRDAITTHKQTIKTKFIEVVKENVPRRGLGNQTRKVIIEDPVSDSEKSYIPKPKNMDFVIKEANRKYPARNKSNKARNSKGTLAWDSKTKGTYIREVHGEL